MTKATVWSDEKRENVDMRPYSSERKLSNTANELRDKRVPWMRQVFLLIYEIELKDHKTIKQKLFIIFKKIERKDKYINKSINKVKNTHVVQQELRN